MTHEEKVKNLKLMHETMMNMNDEDAYYDWIVLGVPDEPMEEDFEEIANNDYKHCLMLFKNLLKAYKYAGIYDPTDEVYDFVSQYVDIERIDRVL